MDRREALKKLAAGSAVAAGASIVLTSNAVAFTASIGDTGVVGFPGPGQELPITPVVNGSGNSAKTVVVDVDTQGVGCSPDGAATILCGWRLISRSTNDIRLTLPSGTIDAISSSYSALNNLDTRIEVSRGGNPSLNGQTYSFGLMTESFCGSGRPYVRTEFIFNGDGANLTQIPGQQTIVADG